MGNSGARTLLYGGENENMAGEGGSRTHLPTCMGKLVLKTSRATGPYPLPAGVRRADFRRRRWLSSRIVNP